MSNRKRKAIIGALMIGTCMVTFTGCGMLEMLGFESKKTDQEQISNHKEKTISQAPELTVDLSGEVVLGMGQEASPITVEAKSLDGGTLTYQWYFNTSNTNAGGTPIEGAINSSLVPKTEQLGDFYYYVVVANSTSKEEIPGMVTSSTVHVKVQEEQVQTEEEKQALAAQEAEKQRLEDAKHKGTWVEDSKGWWFKREDGSFAKGEWIKDGDRWFVVDDSGYMVRGWYQEGNDWYYLGRDGHMIVDFDVDGYHLGPDGKMVS